MTDTTLRKLEWATAGLLTLAAAWFHFSFATHAGGLWRDEVNTIAVATLPTFAEVWNHLQFDSFPILWLLVVRVLDAMGCTSDASLRMVGAGVGLLLVGMLWLHARTMKCHFPLVSLAILALNPSVLVWGDTMRAYGFGMCLIVLTFSLVWRFVEKPTAWRFAAAAIAAVLSVQCLYYNAVLILAVCLGGTAVAAHQRAWRTALLVLMIGGIAAVSLLPYMGTISGAADWNGMVRLPGYDGARFWANIRLAMAPGGGHLFAVWIVLLLGALGLGTAGLRLPKLFKLDSTQRDTVLFAWVTLVIGALAYFIFLKTLRYLTQPWYYVTLLALAGVYIDTLTSLLIPNTVRARILKLALIWTLTLLAIPRLNQVTRQQLTSVDAVAARLNQIATRDDFIVVIPWQCGVTFHRYHHSPARWATVPEITDHRFHRYDLVQQKMKLASQAEAVQSVVDEIARTLQAGHRVYLVGSLDFLKPGEAPPALPAAPNGPLGWYEEPYLKAWSKHVAYFVQRHSASGKPVDISLKNPVSHLEDLPLGVFEGWRP